MEICVLIYTVFNECDEMFTLTLQVDLLCKYLVFFFKLLFSNLLP